MRQIADKKPGFNDCQKQDFLKEDLAGDGIPNEVRMVHPYAPI